MQKVLSGIKLALAVVIALVVLLIATGNIDAAVRITEGILGGIWDFLMNVGEFVTRLAS